MRDLEKGRTLDELLAQHMARNDKDPFHGGAFRYLLREGRIALLFDGFDELALRTSYERVPQHFATLWEAAAGAAKVVDEFARVVQSFSNTSSTRQAWSDAINLTVSDKELAQAQEVAPLIGSTPRAVKRFANVYLLVKAIGTGRCWHPPRDGALMHWLADAIFPALVNNSALPEPSEEDPCYDEYRTFTTWLDERSLGREGLPEWLDLMYRFRFPEGRAGHETGRMER